MVFFFFKNRNIGLRIPSFTLKTPGAGRLVATGNTPFLPYTLPKGSDSFHSYYLLLFLEGDDD